MPYESSDPLSTDLRRASTADFPYGSTLIAYMVVHDGQIRQATFKQAQRLAEEGHTVYGAWPGKWSQDVFVLDDILERR